MVGGYSMEKTFKFISAMALIAAMCLSACNKVEITEDPIDEPGIEVTPSQGWTVAISATMGGDSSTKALAEDPDTHKLLATFETTDAIYVYNKTKNKMDANSLHPDQNGASVTLTGTLAGDYYDAGDEQQQPRPFQLQRPERHAFYCSRQCAGRVNDIC